MKNDDLRNSATAAIPPLAGFGARAMAMAIDVALLTALHCSFFLVLGYRLVQSPPAGIFSMIMAAATYLLLFLLAPGLMAMAYSTVLHAWGGQTVGKIFMGIRVVTVAGQPLSPGIAFLRWVGTIVSGLPLAAGFLWAMVDRNHAAWHDKLAGTKVIAAA
ncbi:MAG: RDD family protein [Desulfobulbaceae bacterium]|nr:RDD family protein [Desulfobulbaceae bacterium]